MKACRIICIGKIRTPFWKDALAHYQKLLAPFRALEISELRDSSGDLPIASRKGQEGSQILASLKNTDFPIALHETGKMLSSPQLARLLTDCDERQMKRPAFIIGGPFGLSAEVLSAARFSLSLSALTFPHELARVLLLEQLFRAESILHNTPYHH